MSFIINPYAFGGVAGVTTLTQHASATSAASSVTGPATIQAGDLLVLWDVSFNGTNPATVVPSGFTSVVNTGNGSTSRVIMSHKIATGAEASASLTGMDGSILLNKMLYVFRGDVPITTVTDDAAANAVTTTGNPNAQTVVASAVAPPLVVLAGYASSGNVNPRTFSVGGIGAVDGEINQSTNAYLAYKIYNAAPADVLIDMDDEGANMLASCYLRVS